MRKIVVRKDAFGIWCLLLIFLILTNQSLLVSQSWSQIDPKVGRDLYDVQFFNNNTGWISADWNTACYTTNGGQNWIRRPGVTGWRYVLDIHFINETSGWALTNNLYNSNTYIQKTTNGGNNWTYQLLSPISSFSIFFIDSAKGWVVGSGGIIFNSSDGGTTWQSQSSGISDNLNCVKFINQTTGLCCGNNGKILFTMNSGSNWTLQNSGTSKKMNSVFLTSSTIFFATGDSGLILKSTNAGVNWIQLNSGTTQNINKIQFRNAINGYAAANGGLILLTTNSGSNWNLSPTSVNSSLTGVFSTSPDTLYAVGGGGAIFKSINNGTNWIRLSISNFEFLQRIQYTSNNTLWLLSYNGATAFSTNGGINFEPRNINFPTIYNYWSQCFINSYTGFVGATGGILKTTNSGLNWINTYQQYASTRTYSLFFIDTLGWAGRGGNSNNAFFLKTTNGGNNWDSYGTPVLYDVNTVFFVDPMTGWREFHDIVEKTTNGGINWSQQSASINYDWSTLFFINSFTGWFIGGQSIYKTTNGGTNWSSQSKPSGGDLNSCYFLNSQTGYAVGNSGAVIGTTNGGNNWYSQVSTTPVNLWSVTFANAFTGWAVGDSGILIKTTDGGGFFTNISILGNELPLNYGLFQNFPNPFNPTTNIKFDIPSSSNVKLTIYDALGREVATLVNKQLNPGTYEVDWSATVGADNFASGIYFYTLSARQVGSLTGEFVETRKMVLIK